MKINIKLTAIAFMLSMFGSATAQTLQWGTPTIVAGTATVTVDVIWNDLGQVVLGIGANTAFDETEFTFASCASTLTTCTDLAPGDNVVNIGNLANPPNGVIATITFNSLTAAVGVHVVGPDAAVPPTWTDALFLDNLIVNTAGSITVTAGPQDYSSAPAPGALTFPGGILAGGVDPALTIAIDNVGLSASTLAYDCAMGGGSDPELTINSGGGPQTLLDTAGTSDVVLSCDAAAAGTFTGNLICTHDGNGVTEASPATYPLSCTIDVASADYVSVPAKIALPAITTINIGTGTSGAGDFTSAFSIENGGDPGTTLNTGGCLVFGGDAGASITFTGPLTAATAILDTAAASTGTLTCLDPGLGLGDSIVRTTTLSCNNDDGNADNGAPVIYTVNCQFDDAGDAVYISNITGDDSDATVFLTAGGIGGLGVPVGAVVASQNLVITNNIAAGQNLEILGCAAGGGDPQITIASPLAAGNIIPGPTSAAAVIFGCDTTVIGDYTNTYTCDYSVDGTGAAAAGSPAVYTHECKVRAAASSGSPADGSSVALSITAPPGGSSNGSVAISETLNEGQNLTAVSCSLDAAATTAGYTILTQPNNPLLAGTTSSVVITLTDGGTPPLTGTATCIYTDSGGAKSFVINLTGAIQAVIVPTLSKMGYVAMIFGLLLVGFFGFRRNA